MNTNPEWEQLQFERIRERMEIEQDTRIREKRLKLPEVTHRQMRSIARHKGITESELVMILVHLCYMSRSFAKFDEWCELARKTRENERRAKESLGQK